MPKRKKKAAEQKPIEEEADILQFLKKSSHYLPSILLTAFMVFGFYLRFYHIEYPVIGYHNWKTAHYITEARNFAREGFFKYGFFVPMRGTMENIDEQAQGAHPDTFPTISIIVGVLFKLFGETLLVARMAGIVMSLMAVIAFYYLIKELFGREDLALLCAFLATINPLYVFFSHNIQLITPALLFMLLGSYFYIKWHKKQLEHMRFSYLYAAAFFIMLSVLTKYSNGVIAIPIIFTFPYFKVIRHWKTFVKPFIVSSLITLAIPLWIIYNEVYVKIYVYGRQMSEEAIQAVGLDKIIDFGVIFDQSFWQITRSYLADNFTLVGVSLAILGAIVFTMMFLSKNRGLGYRFMMGYLISLFPFLIVMGYKLSGHNYHQMPIAPLIIFLMAYFIVVLASNLSSLIKVKELNIAARILIILGMLFVFPLVSPGLYARTIESKDRMFNTQFPGLDIAGDYIREHSLPDERLFHSSGQSFGILWHADRMGYKPPRDAEYFRRAEEQFNVKWVFVYQWAFSHYFQNPEIADYLSRNYRLVQLGFVQQGESAVPIWFLFRKGGSFNDTMLNELVQGKPVLARTYYYTHAPYEVRFINLE